jgi:lipoprotein-anchoring transpeptidase ErfK/SrfK
MEVLSSGAGGRPGQDTRGQASRDRVALDHVALDQAELAPAVRHDRAPYQGAFRVAAAASLGLCFVGAVAAAPADAAHRHHHEESNKAKPEQPKQPTGPLLVAVSIGGQRVTVYDNGTPIATSQISTGMPGHSTPMGIFSVIQKQRWHRSNLYSNAPMPYMQRITWSGVALHAGVVPGYPASHGCIRLPDRFALRLWGMTKMGARVVIARGDTRPYPIDHPRLAALVKPPEADPAPPSSDKPDDVKPDDAKPVGAAISPGAVMVATTGAVSASESGRDPPADPAHSDSGNADSGNAASQQVAAATPAPKGEDVLQRPGQLSLFVSRREGKLFVRKGFMPAFDVPVTIAQPDKPLGTHVFTASHPAGEGSGIRWFGVSLSDRRQPAVGGSTRRGNHKGHAERERPAPVTAESLRQSAVDALDRIELPPEALARLIPLVTQGTSLVISDQGLGGETGKETDFIVVTR